MFVLHDDWHPCIFILEDKIMELNYSLCIKESGDNPYYYADEVIAQSGNQFIYYKPSYKHYCILDTQTGEQWEIPRKDTCISICNKLNDLVTD